MAEMARILLWRLLLQLRNLETLLCCCQPASICAGLKRESIAMSLVVSGSRTVLVSLILVPAQTIFLSRALCAPHPAAQD